MQSRQGSRPHQPIHEDRTMEQSDLDELSVAETQDFLHAASEACQRRAPILSSTSAFGPSTGGPSSSPVPVVTEQWSCIQKQSLQLLK